MFNKFKDILMYMLALINLNLYSVQLYKCKKLFLIYFFNRANKIMVQEKLKKFVNQFSDMPEPYLLLAKFQIHSMQKKGYETLHLFQKKLNEYLLKKNLFDLNVEFIPPVVFILSLGNHWCLDSLIKANLLNLRKAKQLRVHLPSSAVLRNPCLFNYFKDFIDIIDSKQINSKWRFLEKNLTLPLVGLALPLDDKALFLEIGDAFVQQKWANERRPTLLKLKENDRLEGEACLAKLGVPRDAWYVCLHVRQPGYRDGGNPSENFRNANPFTYLKAIEAITNQGGWIIRLGDPISMTPLPVMKNVLDYAHSSYRSPLMDVFLCATCKFCVGTSSGVYNIPRMFGRPVILSNCLPVISTYTLSSEHMTIPRLCRYISSKRVVSFLELYSPPVSMATSSASFKELGLEWIENTEDELEEAVIEMLDRVNNKVEYTQDELALQTQFKTLSKECGYLHGGADVAVNALLPRYFLTKHADLFKVSTSLGNGK